MVLADDGKAGACWRALLSSFRRWGLLAGGVFVPQQHQLQILEAIGSGDNFSLGFSAESRSQVKLL